MSAVIYVLGKNFLDAFMLLLLIESAVALIIGGVYGSIVSSASFHGIERYFKRETGKLRVQLPAMQRDQEEKERKNEIERTKREVRMGKRFVVLGAALLLESILIAFSLIL
ncbi:MAG: hypothetical protein QXP73_00965 [Candidatus Methanomethylicaceae archaeon]